MNHYQQIKSKLLDFDSLLKLRLEWRKAGLKVVFTNGCFDIIHLGHIDYLSKAASLGDKFIIAVNSDQSVSSIKGKTRPLQDEHSRLMVLASMQFVDALFLFHEDTPQKPISLLLPDVLVKGGDYKVEEIAGATEVQNAGGKIVILPFLDGYSTTAIENKILREKR